MTNYWLEMLAAEEVILDNISIPGSPPPITLEFPEIPKIDCNLLLEKTEIALPKTYKAPDIRVSHQPTIPSVLKTGTFVGNTELRDVRNYHKWSTTTHSNYQYDLSVTYYDKEMSSLLLSNIELTSIPCFLYGESTGNTLGIALHGPQLDGHIKTWSFLSNMFPEFSRPMAEPKKGMALLWAYDYENGDYAIFPIDGMFVQSFGITPGSCTERSITATLKFDKMRMKPVK